MTEKIEARPLIEEVKKDIDWMNGRREIAKEDMKFTMGGGGQWKEADRHYVEKQDRLASEINVIKPKVYMVCGALLDAMGDPAVRPTQGDDVIVAEAINSYLKTLNNDNDLGDIRMETAADGIIAGEGYCEPQITFAGRKPIQGSVTCYHRNLFEIFYDRRAKLYDFSDCSRVCRHYWTIKDKIIEAFPRYRQEIEDAVSVEVARGQDTASTKEEIPGKDEYSDPSDSTYHPENGTKVYDIQYRVNRLVSIALMDNGSITAFEDKLSNREKQSVMSTMGGISAFIDKYVPVTRRKFCVGEVEIFDDVILENWIYNGGFSVIRFMSEFFPSGTGIDNINCVQGMVRGMKYAQMELNKLHSKMIDTINRAPAGGIVINSPEDVTHPKGVEGFKKDFNKPASITFIKTGKWEMRDGMPAGAVNVFANAQIMAEEAAKVTSNMHDAFQGLSEGANEAGISIDLKQRQVMLGLRKIFSNFARTDRMISRLNIRHFKELYTDPDGNIDLDILLDIVDLTDDQKVQLGRLQEEGKLTLKSNDVMISNMTSSITQRFVNQQQVAELVQYGLHPKWLIELSDLPMKEEMIREMMEAEAAAQQQGAVV